MTTPITGIFAPAGDRQSRILFEKLELLNPGAAKLFPFPRDGVPGVSLSRDEIYWDGVDVSRLQTAYVRAFSYNNPVIPPPMEDTDWSVWQFEYICEQQKSSFLYSALSEMNRRGVRMSNMPGVYLDVSMKTDLLERIRSADIQVAKLICTNLREEADRFAEENEHVLWRPVTGRAAWQLCMPRQMDALIDTDKTPVLLAAIEPGMLLRCYICNGEPVLCLKYGIPEQTPLERLEVFQAVEDSAFYPRLRAVAAVPEMLWGAIHCVVEDDEITVYDIDADPVLSAMPPEVEDYLCLCLAHGLLGNSAPAADAIMDTALVRSLPFLRRMLTVLFDIERSKYATESEEDSYS